MTQPDGAREPENSGEDDGAGSDTGRVEAFSDGVFAVALTLLVVSLDVPKLGAGTAVDARAVLRALAEQWPQFAAFAASFFSVLLLWISHHRTFAMLRRVSRRLMLANGLLLFLVTLVPFPTAVLARYIRTPAAPVVAALYAGVFLLITAAFVLLWHVALARPGLLRAHITPTQRRDIQRRNTLGLLPYVVAIAAAPWAPYATVGTCVALSVYWVATGEDW